MVLKIPDSFFYFYQFNLSTGDHANVQQSQMHNTLRNIYFSHFFSKFLFISKEIKC